MNYLEEPSDREKQWLERVVGKEANRIIRGANLKRLSISEDKKVKEMRDGIEYDNKHVEGFKRYVSEKYGKVIEEYSFPTDMIEGICIESVFH